MRDSSPSNFEYNKWQEEKSRREAERAHDNNFAFVQKANESVISSSNAALRTTLIINGGAAGALLAFIGNLYAKNPDLIGKSLSGLLAPLMQFVWGVVLATLAIAVAYGTNHAVMSRHAKKKPIWDYPYFAETRASNAWRIASIMLHIAAIVLGAASVVFFIVGMIAIKSSITALAP